MDKLKEQLFSITVSEDGLDFGGWFFKKSPIS